MAITSGQQSIGTAATPIDGRWANPSRITIHNDDNSTNIYLGGADLTTSNGLLLLKEQSYQFELEPLEQLYVVSTKTGHTISWLRQAV
jgi:hypothetical protein